VYVGYVQSNQAGALLGFSVAGTSDHNEDGLPDVAIGLPMWDYNHADEGAMWILDQYGIWLDGELGGQAGAHLGVSLASGDWNGDGHTDLSSGALDYDVTPIDADEGAVFSY
jgi:hypothetical protein